MYDKQMYQIINAENCFETMHCETESLWPNGPDPYPPSLPLSYTSPISGYLKLLHEGIGKHRI